MADFRQQISELDARLRSIMSADQVATAERLALEWMPESLMKAKAAAEKGDAAAQYEFGLMLKSPRLVGEPRHDDAAAWFRRAADQGHAAAQYQLGEYYAYTKEDVAQAVRWYQRAAERGHLRAQHQYGLYFAIGKGVPRSPTDACFWFRKAADGRLNDSYDYVAECYMRGSGVAQDSVEAYKWLLLADPQRSGRTDLINLMKRLEQRMTKQQVAEAASRAAQWKRQGGGR
jgi:hypothetical protein